MKRKLTMGSLFSGSGGFELASVLAGITPVWASEIEPFPIRVTTKRLPNMKHYGDVSAISGAEVPPVDIITFGSPCQDLSTANGNRQGLAGSRSGLFLEAIRIIKEMREATNGVYPAVAVWENVPGAFSANGGEDFRRVLEEFANVRDESVSIPRPAGGRWNDAGEIVADGWSVAWRVLDAQYWGVPQRRRRIFLVADFGGQRAGRILLVRESLCGHPFAGNAERKEAPAGTGRRADETGGGGAIGFYPQMKAESMCITEETQPCLVNGTNPGFQNGVCIPLEGNGSRPSHQGDGYGQAGGPAYTLNTVEQHAVCYRKSARAQSSDDGETWVRDERANTLNTFDLGDTRTSQAIVTANAIGNGQADQTGLHDKAGALNCMHDQQAVLVYNNHPNDSRVTGTSGGVLDTLSSQMGTGGNNTPLVATAVDCRNGTEDYNVNNTLQSTAGHNINSNNIVRVPLSFQERAGCAGGAKAY